MDHLLQNKYNEIIDENLNFLVVLNDILKNTSETILDINAKAKIDYLIILMEEKIKKMKQNYSNIFL